MKVGHPDNAGLQPSQECYDFIESWEEYRAKRYKDQAGIWTTGIGEIGEKAQIADYIMSREEAVRLFRSHVRKDVARVKQHVKVGLSQNQFDALVSWEYNTGGLVGSTLLKVLNSGDYDGAVEQMRRWDKITDPKTKKKVVSRGLKRRREAEAAMFLMSALVTKPPQVDAATTNVKGENTDKAIGLTKTSIGSMIGGGAGVAGSGAALINDMSDVGKEVTETAGSLVVHADKGTSFYAVMITLILVGTALALLGRWHARRKGGA